MSTCLRILAVYLSKKSFYTSTCLRGLIVFPSTSLHVYLYMNAGCLHGYLYKKADCLPVYFPTCLLV